MTKGPKGLTGRIESLSSPGVWVAGVAASAAAVALVSGVAGGLLHGSRLWTGWEPVALAGVVTVAATIIGLWPLGQCEPDNPKRIVKAANAAMPIRIGTALVLGVLILLAIEQRADRRAFGIWLAGLYLVSLAAETAVLAVWLRARPGET